MPKSYLALALAFALSSITIHAAGFADTVISYNAGAGFAPGYTNTAAALGEPSRVTPGQFGGPVDPFSPPYLDTQLLSVGSGGSLVVRFDSFVLNNPANPSGIDFMVFGNSGFTITNADFSGGGITDGSLFSHNDGSTRVSVSEDNLSYYELSPALSPIVDGFFPTDGSGDFLKAVDPSLTGASFAGKDLAGIRALYNGSGGGSGFDIGWARDARLQPIDLAGIRYVRIDVLSGHSEIDGVSAVPEPATVTLLMIGAAALGFDRLRRKS